MADFGENYSEYDGEFSNKISEFYTNQVFMSHPDMMQWVQNTGRQHGYVIVTERSKKNARKDVTKVYLRCDRGGEYKGASTVRRSATRKTGCRFQLSGKYEKDVNGWKLSVKHAIHNHPPAQHLEGHPFAMRLTNQEMHLLEGLSKHDVQPRNILATLKGRNPENVSSLKTLYNARQKIRKATEIGSTPMQVLFSLLHSEGYFWEHQESDGVLEQLFFIHKTSYKMWRAFPHVLLIDATYKTNRYNMPFVEIVGVTSTKKTYCVAFALISKERQDNFIWVLNNLKVALNKCMEPRVIITDRDLALMNACKRVFPEASQLLCRWHISQNIGKHCKQSLDSHEWAVLHTMWSVLIESPTADIYNYNYKLLSQMFSSSHQRVLDHN